MAGTRICRNPVAIIGLDYVQVAVPIASETDACGFYREVLGLPELQKPEALRSHRDLWSRIRHTARAARRRPILPSRRTRR